ncbi:hypothetical protein C8R45DRAFT_831025 [Mycena sanguinolenta]|nr:hypothetical protein C8R45DRAFT_831025 [Mycena sanguinolenta]
MVNAALKRDIRLTNKIRFGGLSLRRQLVLDTWSGTLADEDSLPDDWINTKGVLVGIWPINNRFGIG